MPFGFIENIQNIGNSMGNAMGDAIGDGMRWAGDKLGIDIPGAAQAAPARITAPAVYGPGGDPSGSGLGQAQSLSADVRPQALRETISAAEGTANADGSANYSMRFGDSRGSAGSLDITAPHPVTPRPSPWGGSSGSNASGAYQFLDSTWGEMNDGQNVPMTPQNQDRSVDRLLDERIGYDRNRPFSEQITDLSGTWASFPNEQGVSNYNQPVKSEQELMDIYNGRYQTLVEQERDRVYGLR